MTTTRFGWSMYLSTSLILAAWGLTGLSNQELAKRIRDVDDLRVWGAMLDSLIEMEKAHKAVVENLGYIQARILAAMHQAYPDPDEAI